jgi:hypothetical protein
MTIRRMALPESLSKGSRVASGEALAGAERAGGTMGAGLAPAGIAAGTNGAGVVSKLAGGATDAPAMAGAGGAARTLVGTKRGALDGLKAAGVGTSTLGEATEDSSAEAGIVGVGEGSVGAAGCIGTTTVS